MSAEEYFQGPGDDTWLRDPCDWTPNSCNDDQVYELRFAPYGHRVASLDMKKAKVAALTETVQLPDETKIIKTTKKAILFLLPNQQKLWVPKYGIVTWPPSTVILSKFWIAPDSTDAVFANPVTFNRMQPRCPYCGERGCDCGTPV